jgi:hypothetical protein
MIISHKYKFIFIKTAKTAGTSIEVFLSQHCGLEDIVTPIYPHIENHIPKNYKGIWNPFSSFFAGGRGVKRTIKDFLIFYKYFNHINACEVKSLVSDKVWKNYFKFCVERNPWDKTISHYFMMKDRSVKNINFDEYLLKEKFCLNYPKYTDKSGNIIVDQVLKYESLIEEISQVFKVLDVPFHGTLGVQAKSEHRQDRRPYQKVYTQRQREIIEKAFFREIEMHGYRYD